MINKKDVSLRRDFLGAVGVMTTSILLPDQVLGSMATQEGSHGWHFIRGIKTWDGGTQIGHPDGTHTEYPFPPALLFP